MPEIGQSVQLHIPEEDETKAYITKVNRTDGEENDKTQDPDTKYFGTMEGKEMKFSPAELTVSASEGDTYFTLSDEGGVEIHSSNEIVIKTEQELFQNCNSIEVTSQDKILLATMGSSIVVDDVMHIKG